MDGFLFVASSLYLTLAIALVLSLRETPRLGQRLVRATLKLWGQFVGGLLALCLVVWLLS